MLTLLEVFTFCDTEVMKEESSLACCLVMATWSGERINDATGEGKPKADPGEGGSTRDDPVEVALQF